MGKLKKNRKRGRKGERSTAKADFREKEQGHQKRKKKR